MANTADLKPFDMMTEVIVKCKKYDALVVDVGRNEHGLEVKSQQHLLDLLHGLLSRPDKLKNIRSLYILGAWRLTPSNETWEGFGEDPKYHEGEPHVFTKQEEEWHLAGKNIARLASAMPNLEELIWLASLAFTAHVWEGLNTSMTKIIIDLGYPVRLIVNGFSAHEAFITSDELKPLVQQTKLKELRLFHMKDDSYSYQPVIWGTVYRNTNEDGMRILDINMADPPIVRSEDWRKAKDVAGLTVAHCKAGDKDYKGVDGKGILHYSFGTGEYLDFFCMRKARIAAKINHTEPLRLQCLKLNGFVIDHLPFEQELSGLELLTCGDKCFDAGLRAPKTRHAPLNPWSGAVNNAPSHCMIVWPNWQGIFDAAGHQRDGNGEVVAEGVVVSTPVDQR